MSARYLVRFDDICPTMNWRMWERIEGVLKELGIKPILAVVPDNRDPSLYSDPPKEEFWEQVRRWQANGWFIALHGYQHLYETQDAGLLGINPFSEFAGLPYDVQKAKLTSALRILSDQRVRANGWVAPAHSFDATTVKVLLELGIDVISDGFYRWPIRRLGATWLPQQVWRFRSMPAGVWTVCVHHNTMSEASFEAFRTALQRFAPQITSAASVLQERTAPAPNLADQVFALTWRAALKLKLRRRPLDP